MLFCLKAPKRSPSFFFLRQLNTKDMYYYLERLCVVFIIYSNLCRRMRGYYSSPCRRRARLESLITFELNTKDDDTSKEDVSAFTTVVVVIEYEDSPPRRRRRTRRESENGRPGWSKCSRR